MSAVRALRERLGNDGMSGLDEVINDAGKRWKDDVLAVAAERFDKRLAEEIGALRVDLAKEFGSVRVDMGAIRADMAKEFGTFRAEMAKDIGRVESNVLKWAFLFWIGQVAAMTAVGSFLIRSWR